MISADCGEKNEKIEEMVHLVTVLQSYILLCFGERWAQLEENDVEYTRVTCKKVDPFALLRDRHRLWLLAIIYI